MGCPKIIYYQVQEGLEKSAITILRGLDQKKTTLKKGYSYYPFGLSFNSWKRSNSLKNKLNTFQDQELIEDLDLGWVQFKWRNHTAEIGRFFNIDPLAEKYVYNSPYAFSENRVIDGIELEGLEKLNFMVANFTVSPDDKDNSNYREIVTHDSNFTFLVDLQECSCKEGRTYASKSISFGGFNKEEEIENAASVKIDSQDGKYFVSGHLEGATFSLSIKIDEDGNLVVTSIVSNTTENQGTLITVTGENGTVMDGTMVGNVDSDDNENTTTDVNVQISIGVDGRTYTDENQEKEDRKKEKIKKQVVINKI